MKERFSHIFLRTAGFVLIPFLLFCGKGRIKPIVSDPAYSAELIFHEDFNQDLGNWFEAGQGKTVINGDSALFMQLGSVSRDMVLWSRRDFSGNYQIEYKITFADTPGTHILFFCARGIGGQNVTEMNPPPQEQFEQYIEDSLASYQISCHAYDETGRFASNSRVRKNPGNLLLSSVPTDPCAENRDYIMDIFKIDNRIQFYVDGILVHDLRDRGGYSPTYTTGKIGFYIHGQSGVFSVVLDEIRVFKLIPK